MTASGRVRIYLLIAFKLVLRHAKKSASHIRALAFNRGCTHISTRSKFEGVEVGDQETLCIRAVIGWLKAFRLVAFLFRMTCCLEVIDLRRGPPTSSDPYQCQTLICAAHQIFHSAQYLFRRGNLLALTSIHPLCTLTWVKYGRTPGVVLRMWP